MTEPPIIPIKRIPAVGEPVNGVCCYPGLTPVGWRQCTLPENHDGDHWCLPD